MAVAKVGYDLYKDYSATTQLIKAFTSTGCPSGCTSCYQIKAEAKAVATSEDELTRLCAMVNATKSLGDQINFGKPLPEELPLIIGDEISMDGLRVAMDQFKGDLNNIAQDTAADISKWVDLGQLKVSTILKYFDMAVSVQNNAGSVVDLQTRAAIVQRSMGVATNAEGQVVTAVLLLAQQRQQQASLVLQYLFDEWKQVNYFTLGKAPAISLPGDPRSADVLQMQRELDAAVATELASQGVATHTWAYIELNATNEPNTISSMRQNGSALVSLNLPFKEVTVLTEDGGNRTSLIADTKFHNVRMSDVAVYLLDANHKTMGAGAGHPVHLTLSKYGESSFFDDSFALHTFTHEPLSRNNLAYDSSTSCPMTSSDCGAMCETTFINYSPYGVWALAVPDAADQAVDLTSIATLRFEFKVSYHGDGGSCRTWFGKGQSSGSPAGCSYRSGYNQDVGSLCRAP